MTKSTLGLSAASAVMAHNAGIECAPALSPAKLGAEISAIAVLREHGAAGLSMLSMAEQDAIVARMLAPVTGVGEASAPLMRKRTAISSWSALLSYASAAMAHRGKEQFRVFFLDKKNQLIADEVMSEGTVDHAPVYPREVVARALALDASAIILAHNHPSGDPTPSSADVAMTRQIVEAARPLSIMVHDHIVVGRDGIASLKALGLWG